MTTRWLATLSAIGWMCSTQVWAQEPPTSAPTRWVGPAEAALPDTASDAARVAAQACDDGDLDPCLTLAELYRTGTGVPEDAERAFLLVNGVVQELDALCAQGEDDACDRLRALQAPTRSQ